MKKLFAVSKGNKKNPSKHHEQVSRTEIEKKAIEGAKKAVKDYGRVFERLAEYDRN